MRLTALIPALLISIPPAVAAQVPRLAHVGTFGCSECTGPTRFSTIHALGVATDGSILVVDDDEPMVRVFDASGSLVRGFGRAGGGPGELRVPVGVGTMGDVLVVTDLTNQRLTTYDTTSAVLGTHRLSGMPTAAASPPNSGPPILAITRFTAPEVSLLRFDGDSLVEMRRVGAPLFPERPALNFDMVSVAAAADGTFAVGDGIGAYRIILFNADASQRGVILRDVPRARLSAEEMRALAAQRERNMANARERAAAEGRSPRTRLTPPPIPEERNFFLFGALAFDEGRRLWVRVERGPLTATTFDVFDPSGRYLGEVRLDARVRRFALGAGMLVAETLDELDVPSISVWRID